MSAMFALVAAVSIAQSAPAQRAPAEAAIPFVRSDGIAEWRADGAHGLFIRSITGEWYYARTMTACGRLRSAITIGFETRGPDQLDHHGTLLVEGWRCPLASLTRSEAPPRRRR